MTTTKQNLPPENFNARRAAAVQRVEASCDYLAAVVRDPFSGDRDIASASELVAAATFRLQLFDMQRKLSAKHGIASKDEA